MSNETPAVQPPSGDRVSSVAGHRLCDDCAFQLLGTPVLREDRYGLLVVQCPECGHVHPASEPARLTKKRLAGNRLATLAWLFVKLAAIVASVAITSALTYDMAESSMQKYANEIDRAGMVAFTTLRDELDDPAAAARQLGYPSWAISNASDGLMPEAIGVVWWEDNRDAVLEDAGGPFDVVAWDAFHRMTPNLLWLALFGTGFAVIFPHVRTKRLMLFAPVIAGIAALLTWQMFSNRSANLAAFGSYLSTYQAAMTQAGPIPTFAALGLSLIPLSAGILAGRPLARGLVRAMLRPELRDPFQDLWLADGKPLPRPTRRWPR